MSATASTNLGLYVKERLCGVTVRVGVHCGDTGSGVVADICTICCVLVVVVIAVAGFASVIISCVTSIVLRRGRRGCSRSSSTTTMTTTNRTLTIDVATIVITRRVSVGLIIQPPLPLARAIRMNHFDLQRQLLLRRW